MLKRTENGKLSFNSLDFEVFLGDMFEICKNEREIDWLYDNMQGCLDLIREEATSDLD